MSIFAKLHLHKWVAHSEDPEDNTPRIRCAKCGEVQTQEQPSISHRGGWMGRGTF